MNPAAITALLFLTSLLHAVETHSNGIDASVCDDFNVGHGGGSDNDSHQVTVEVLENGEPVNCFVPQTEYQVRLSSTGAIRGFLLQAVSGAKLPSRKQDVPQMTTWGPCSNSVSHTEALSSSSPDLVFPITTKKSRRPAVFRHFQQNRYWELPCCAQEDHESSNSTLGNATDDSSNSTVGNATASNMTEPNATATPLEPVENYNCGKTVHHINKVMNYTHTNGVRYNCTINKPLKQTECEPSCMHEGRPITCEIATCTPRRKGYMCVAYQDGQDLTNVDPDEYMIEETFDEEVTSNCQCYYTA